MKLNFSTMNRKELRVYVVSHRDDEDTFFAYIDRSNQEATWVDYPPVDSVESLQQFPLYLEKFRQESHPDNR